MVSFLTISIEILFKRLILKIDVVERDKMNLKREKLLLRFTTAYLTVVRL